MGSNEAYLDELLKTMSQREEDAQNGVTANEAEPVLQSLEAEPEPSGAPMEQEAVLESGKLSVEPEPVPEFEELSIERETVPEVEVPFEELLSEPEQEGFSAEPEFGLEFEELSMEPETDELFAEPEAGMGFDELSIEPEPGTNSEELLLEPETLFAESAMTSDEEVSKPDAGQESLTNYEEDDTLNAKPSTEEVKDMSEEEILQLLQLSAGEGDQAEAGNVAGQDKEIADDDLDKLLKDMEQGDDNLAEINDLLYKAENNQPVGNEGEESAASPEQETENTKKGKKKKERKGFFSRKKKDKPEEEGTAVSEAGQEAEELEAIFALGTDGEPDGTEPGAMADVNKDGEKKAQDQKEKTKKPGFFSKIMDFLLEEDEDPDTEGVNEESDQLKTTTDENQEVLKQLKKEDQEGKKKKKKKGKGKASAEEDAENEEEGDEEAGKEKKKKAKKEKKEKKEKPAEPADDTPQPKLSKKKVRSTVLFAFTIMAAIMICCLFIPELTQLSDARNAYYDGDYETCFRTLYGKRLSESDQRMFEQSQMMLSVNRNLEAYENYVAVGDELHALDTLLQAVQKQDRLLSEAEKYGLTAEAEAAYQRVLDVLAEKYQLTEAEAVAINAYEQDAVYTLRVKSIVEGTEFVLPAYLQDGSGAGTQPQESAQEEIVEDILSEEEELPDMEYEEGILEP